MRTAVGLLLVVFLAGGIGAQEMRISLERVDTLIDGQLPCNFPITFYFRIANTSTHDFHGSANGFRIYSPDGATWSPGFSVDSIPCDPFPCDSGYISDTTWYGEFIDSTLPNGLMWKGTDPQIYDGGLFVNTFSVDGAVADTVGFAGFDQYSGVGLYSGFDFVGWKIRIASISKGSAGRTICIDSSYFPPSGTWLWANDTVVVPDWDGPYCWTVSVAEPPPPPPPPGMSVRLDSVEGLVKGRLPIGRRIAFRFRFTNTSGPTIEGLANGFRIYSPDGATWIPGIASVDSGYCDPTPCPGGEWYFYDTSYYGLWESTTLPPPLVWKGADPQVFDGGLFVNWYSLKGEGADTVGFAGYTQTTGLGLYRGLDIVGPTIVIQGIPESSSGKTLCIDSAYFPPAGRWIWANDEIYVPTWDGPHCFEIGDCCVGMRGNVDLTDDAINIADLTGLVHQIFVKRQLDCPLACNVDGDPNETVDIMDLAYLVDYMFKGGPAPAACP